MLENTKRPMPTEDWDSEKETLASPVTSVAPRTIVSGMVDQSDKVGNHCKANPSKCANRFDRMSVYYLP